MTELQAIILAGLAGICAGVSIGVVVMQIRQPFNQSEMLTTIKVIFVDCIKQLQGEQDDLEAQSCGKDCGKRKPTSVINKEKLDRIGEKFYIKGPEESKEIHDEPCDVETTAEDEQDDIEAREAAENTEPLAFVRCHRCRKDTAGNIIMRDGKPFCSEQCRSEYLMSISGDQDENHATAQEKMDALSKGDDQAPQNEPESEHEPSVDAGGPDDDLKTNDNDNNSLPVGGDVNEIEKTT